MHGALIVSILLIGGIFFGLTLLIVGNKAWRESRDAWRRARRRVLEPLILAYAHGDDVSLLPTLGGKLRRRDRAVVEAILLDHMQRVKGIESKRMGRALDDLGYVDRYLAGLDGSRWWRRALAAENLGLAGALRGTRALVAVLDDHEPEVRLRAAKALGALGGTAAVQPLIGALREPNRWSTIRIADILSSMGREVVDELVKTFPTLSLPGKLAALDILGRMRALQTSDWLRQRLSDPERDVRARACHALGSIGDPAAGPPLAAALTDPEWPVRAMAAKALGKIRYAEAVSALRGTMRDREWWVRANAAEALRQIGPQGLEALERMLDDEDVYARHQAVLMLEEAGELDRHVAGLADGGPGRKAAEAVVSRFIQVGQLGRLRELASSHANAQVRASLTRLLPPVPVAKEEKR